MKKLRIEADSSSPLDKRGGMGSFFNPDETSPDLCGKPLSTDEVLNMAERGPLFVVVDSHGVPSLDAWVSAVGAAAEHFNKPRPHVYRGVLPQFGEERGLKGIISAGLTQYMIKDAMDEQAGLVGVSPENVIVYQEKQRTFSTMKQVGEFVMRCMDFRYQNDQVSEALKEGYMRLYNTLFNAGVTVAGGGFFLDPRVRAMFSNNQTVFFEKLLEVFYTLGIKIGLITIHGTYVKEGETHGPACNCKGCGLATYAARKEQGIYTPDLRVDDSIRMIKKFIAGVNTDLDFDDETGPFSATRVAAAVFDTKGGIMKVINQRKLSHMTDEEKEDLKRINIAKPVD